MINTPAATNEQIFWIIVTASTAKQSECSTRRRRLFLGKPQNWTEQVEHALSIDTAFVQGVYALCTKRNSAAASIGFLLRGLGCPPEEVDARIQELSIVAVP